MSVLSRTPNLSSAFFFPCLTWPQTIGLPLFGRHLQDPPPPFGETSWTRSVSVQALWSGMSVIIITKSKLSLHECSNSVCNLPAPSFCLGPFCFFSACLTNRRFSSWLPPLVAPPLSVRSPGGESRVPAAVSRYGHTNSIQFSLNPNILPLLRDC